MRLKNTEANFNRWILQLPTFIKINIIFLLSSLGIVTIVPSLVALIRQLTEIQNGDVSAHPIRRYLELLKIGFKRNILLGILYSLVIIFLVLDINLALSVETFGFKLIGYVFGSLLVVVLFSLQYLVHLLARLNQPTTWYVKTSILIAINYLPETILLFMIALIPFIILNSTPLFFFTIILIMLFCGSTLLIALQNYVLRKRVFLE